MGLGRQSNSDTIYLIIILFFEGKTPDKYLKNLKGFMLSFPVRVELTNERCLKKSGASCLISDEFLKSDIDLAQYLISVIPLLFLIIFSFVQKKFYG